MERGRAGVVDRGWYIYGATIIYPRAATRTDGRICQGSIAALDCKIGNTSGRNATDKSSDCRTVCLNASVYQRSLRFFISWNAGINQYLKKMTAATSTPLYCSRDAGLRLELELPADC